MWSLFKKAQKIILIISLLFITCTTYKIEDSQGPIINPAFKTYVQNFIDVSEGSVREEDFEYMGIKFADLKSSLAGTCYVSPWNSDIRIDKSWWKNNKSQLVREELLFHEFGHCVLYRSHTIPTSHSGFAGWLERLLFKLGILNKQKEYLDDGCPSSYMYPYVIGEYCIEVHYYYYLKELFSKNLDEEIIQEIIIEEQACPEPRIVNWTDTWTSKDRWTLNRAKFVCRKSYNACLYEFTKKSDLAYTAWCKDAKGSYTILPEKSLDTF